MQILPRADKPLIRIILDPKTYGRFGVSENYTGDSLADKTFCAPDACASPAARCPAGNNSKLPPLTPLPDEADLGVATGSAQGRGEIFYFSPQGSGYCEPKPVAHCAGASSGMLLRPKVLSGAADRPSAVFSPFSLRRFSAHISGSCEPDGPGMTASSFGDPHLTSFGGIDLDFQTAGEFTLLRSTTSHDLDIQARQQPELGPYFSVDTAIAMRVAGSIVEVDRPLSFVAPLTILVNRRPTHARYLKLAGGGELERVSLEVGSTVGVDGSGIKAPGVKVRWPDGTYVEVLKNALGISLLVKVAPDRSGHLTGLLGNAGVPAIDAFRGREGRTYSPSELEGDARSLDRRYGASWRISQRESLFTYARHRNTRSYTIANFPKHPFNEGDVPLAKALHAEALCREAGSTNLALLQDCEYDVLASGKPAYADSDALLQSDLEAGPPAQQPSTTTLSVSTPAIPPASAGATPSSPPEASPQPGIDLGAGEAPPAVAYDPTSGDTYVVWEDPSSYHIVDLCVVPAGEARAMMVLALTSSPIPLLVQACWTPSRYW